MVGKKLCSHCETRKKSYELDPHSPVCPYLHCRSRRKCTMFKKLEEPEKRSFLSCAWEKIIDAVRKINL